MPQSSFPTFCPEYQGLRPLRHSQLLTPRCPHCGERNPSFKGPESIDLTLSDPASPLPVRSKSATTSTSTVIPSRSSSGSLTLRTRAAETARQEATAKINQKKERTGIQTDPP